MKLKIRIPENINEIRLESYQKFAQIEEPTDEDILNCFYGISTKDTYQLKVEDVEDMLNSIDKALEKQPTELQTTFILDGVKYGFIPSLDEMSYGENTDITKYISDPKTFHKSMAVLFRPVIQEQFGKYLIEPYQGSHKYEKVMRSAPLGVFLSTQVFFYHLTKDLLNYILDYLKEEDIPQHLVENGESIRSSINLAKTFNAQLKKPQKLTYTRHYCI